MVNWLGLKIMLVKSGSKLLPDRDEFKSTWVRSICNLFQFFISENQELNLIPKTVSSALRLAPYFSFPTSTFEGRRSLLAVIASGHCRLSLPAVIAGGRRRRSLLAVVASGHSQPLSFQIEMNLDQ